MFTDVGMGWGLKPKSSWNQRAMRWMREGKTVERLLAGGSTKANSLPLLSVNSKITHVEGHPAEQYTISLPLR